MITVEPKNVISAVRNHLIGDGFEFVLDMDKSHHNMMHDALTGRELLDFYSCFASNPLGFNHPKLTDSKTLKRLTQTAVHNVTNSDLFTTYKAEFVETFFKLAAPPEMKYMFLIAGGGLAVENALKAAFDWKIQRNRMTGDTFGRGTKAMHFKGAFHGRTGYTMSLTNTDPTKTDGFPKFDWPRIENPYIVFPDKGKNRDDLKEREKLALKQAKNAIYREGSDIAAMIIEPIQGEGGDNHFRSEFLKDLQDLCNENEIMFIVDEIQTGMGLTGKMWAYEHFGLKPDMICFGKKTQVCGILSSDRIDSVDNHVFNTSSRINSTWGGNLVDMVRCQRYLEIIEEDKLVQNAADMGKLMLDELNKLEKKHSVITNVRGRGLMCAFDLPTTAERDNLRVTLYEAGILVLSAGTRSIRFRPTLIVTKKDIEKGMAGIDKVLSK